MIFCFAEKEITAKAAPTQTLFFHPTVTSFGRGSGFSRDGFVARVPVLRGDA